MNQYLSFGCDVGGGGVSESFEHLKTTFDRNQTEVIKYELFEEFIYR
jgi:hypothetical protein